jgi:hypothetical protein
LTSLAHAVIVAGAQGVGTSVFFDSGGNFNSHLISVMSPENYQVVLSRIAVAPVLDLDSLGHLLDGLREMPDVKVIVIDSITRILNLSAPPGSKERQRMLFRTLEVLRGAVNEIGAHLLITDYSATDWRTGARRPMGGNVILHGVDSTIRVDSITEPSDGVRLEVEHCPLSPNPGGVVVRITPRGIKPIR